MFIATTHTPKKDITKEQALEDFSHLLGRTCEYVKELESMGKTKKGIYMPLYDSIIADAKKAIDENWSE
jgi:hypothetical protein